MSQEQPPTGEQPPALASPAAEEARHTPAPKPQQPNAEQHEAEPTPQPQIWVGSLADYNNGVLHGAWVDAARDPDEIQADINTMLAASPWTARTGEPAEEWAIHDYDGFGPLRIDEHENLGWISRVAKGIAEHGLAFAAYADVMQAEELLASFDKAYQGHYDSLTAYVEQLINELGYDELLDRVVPTSLRPYVKINVAATARDLLRGDLHVLPATEGGVWIFRG